MKKESIRALNQIKALADADGQFKRYMRVQEATRNYQLDRRILQEIAIDCGALYKINTIKGLVEANGRTTDSMDENEENDLQTYLGTLKNYIDENVERHQVDVVTGYGKNTRKSEDDSDGVTAPRKNTQASCSVKAPRKKM